MKYLLGLFLLVFLSSCQTHHTGRAEISAKDKRKIHHTKRYINTAHDGAPHGPVPKHFQAVHPKSEPLSRYGNPDSYTVYGKNYQVMTSTSGFKARGLASWYGTKFHSRRTSSGEDYDMYALTAAHKTLPLPTYIKVKNLNNRRTAIVKVNDRGPFHSGRIIDLSYGAAVKLGLFPRGTAPVEIEALNTRGNHHVAHFYLQAGAFDSNVLAEALRNKLSHLTTSPVFIEKMQRRYLVRVGPFADKNMTLRLKQNLSVHGVPGAFSLLM